MSAEEWSHSAWRTLESEWAQARECWRDSTTEFFDRNYWGPLEAETATHLRVMYSVMEVLRQAQQEAGAW